MRVTQGSVRKDLAPAAPRACSQCPWRESNQGTRHPDGWYTKKNLRFLWSKLRQGDSMTCHPTDPNNPVPEGWKIVPEETTTHECTGSLILKQRELMKYQREPTSYFRTFARGMSRYGLARLIQSYIFGQVAGPLGEPPMPKPNLNDADVQYIDGVGRWNPKEWVSDN